MMLPFCYMGAHGPEKRRAWLTRVNATLVVLAVVTWSMVLLTWLSR